MPLEKTFDEFIRENHPEILKENIFLDHIKFNGGILFAIKFNDEPIFSFFSIENSTENQILFCVPELYYEIEKYFSSSSNKQVLKWVEKEYGLEFFKLIPSTWVKIVDW